MIVSIAKRVYSGYIRAHLCDSVCLARSMRSSVISSLSFAVRWSSEREGRVAGLVDWTRAVSALDEGSRGVRDGPDMTRLGEWC